MGQTGIDLKGETGKKKGVTGPKQVQNLQGKFHLILELQINLLQVDVLPNGATASLPQPYAVDLPSQLCWVTLPLRHQVVASWPSETRRKQPCPPSPGPILGVAHRWTTVTSESPSGSFFTFFWRTTVFESGQLYCPVLQIPENQQPSLIPFSLSPLFPASSASTGIIPSLCLASTEMAD